MTSEPKNQYGTIVHIQYSHAFLAHTHTKSSEEMQLIHDFDSSFNGGIYRINQPWYKGGLYFDRSTWLQSHSDIQATHI